MMAASLLIVDDHAGFRAAARRLLEADGWDVVGEAADGAGALAAARALRPDVILLDIGLPDVDGFAIAEQLAGGPARVILVSSRDRAAYGDRIGLSPVAGFIEKDRLDGDRVRAVLDHRDAGGGT